jgi:hypothetical protein
MIDHIMVDQLHCPLVCHTQHNDEPIKIKILFNNGVKMKIGVVT